MKLNLPEQSAPIESSTPSHPRMFKKVLSALPNTNMGELTKQTFLILRDLNRQTMPNTDRLENLEMLRVTSRLIFDNLKKYFINRTLPLPEKSQKIVNLNQSILRELAHGYEIIAYEAANNIDTKIDDKTLSTAICRAINYLTETLLRSSEVYTPCPKDLWLEAHQLYVYAETKNLTENIVDDVERETRKTTIEDSYKQILLFALARPIALRQRDSERLYKELFTWSKYASLHRHATESQVDHLFSARIHHDSAPSYLTKEDLADSVIIRTLDTSKLVAHLQLLIIEEQEKQKKKIAVGDTIPLETLHSLVASWGVSAKRRFARAERHGHINISIGLTQASKAIRNSYKKAAPVDTTSGFIRTSASSKQDPDFTLQSISKSNDEGRQGYMTHTEIGTRENNSWDMVAKGRALTDTYDKAHKFNDDALLKSHNKNPDSHWEIVNISAGGYRLRWNSDDTSKAQIGELIALQEFDTKNNFVWRIGVIRWMQFTHESGLEIGVQLLSPKVVSATAQRNNKPNETPFECLMLPGIKALNQASSTILPSHAFKPGEKLVVQVADKKHKITLNETREHTGSFTQFMYKNSEEEQRIKKQEVEDKIINLIIIDDSFDSEEEIISKLRTAGYTAKSTRVEDDEDLIEALNTNIADLVIYFEGMELISLKQTIACLKKDKKTQDCRVIVVNKETQPDVVTALRAGAVDATNFSDIDHLLLIIAREQQSLMNARRIAKLTHAFKESEIRCTSLLDSSRDAIAYIHEGMHVYSNQSYLEMFDIAESDDLEGMPILDMVAIDDRDKFKEFLRNYTKTGANIENIDTKLRRPDGEEFSGDMEFSPAQIDGEPCIQIIIRKEDTGSEELERQLKLLSQQDQLTGLLNRQYFIERLENTIEDCVKNTYTAALIEIHIDSFDEIKSSVGVVESDKYIIAAAKALSEAMHEGDLLARYTHDSFAVIAIDYTKENIGRYATELQKTIAQLETDINGSSINTTCCAGIALIDGDSPEYNDILARSEKAVASASAKGANQICIYLPNKGELTRHEVDAKFKEQLTDALKNDRFVLHYQPIVSLHGDTDERYEVFIRLETNGSAELIMPIDFLPAAERIGMAIAIAIDRWVLYQTIQAHCARQKKGKTTRFFIKLSASSVKDETLIDWLSYHIKEKKIPDNTLNFAIKETVAVTNLKNAKALSQKLKALKCGLVLDDFGSGTNPFQLLEHVHVDYIRMESGFMKNLAENAQNQESIKLIAEQANQLGKLSIAQHVPDAGSLSLLWGMGINFIQGYFLQEPSSTMEYDFTEM